MYRTFGSKNYVKMDKNFEKSVNLFDKLFELQYDCKNLLDSKNSSSDLSKHTKEMCKNIIDIKYKDTPMASYVFSDKRFNDEI